MDSAREHLLALLVMGTLLLAGIAGAAALTIDLPSSNETVMAEMRDFYVTGAVPAGITIPGDIRIEVFVGSNATGTPVRVLQSHVDPATGTTPRSAIAADYLNGTAKGTVMVPDLVREPGSLLDTWNKVVVTPEYYSGLVLGGASKHFDTNYTDREGRPLADLTAGEYTVRVTGLSAGLAGLTAEKRITLGRTHAALGRFSPPAQKNLLIAFAREHGYRTYLDSFPGYFYWNGAGYVIPGRWVTNNAIEVVNDCAGTAVDTSSAAENELFLYDIRNYSATYTVEVSTIVRTGMADSPQTVYHYYTAGEPTFTYVARENGTRVSFDSALSKLANADRLALTRAEFRSEGMPDPIVDLADITPKRLDLAPGDGISVELGETCLIYGVVAPIPAPVVPGPSGKDGRPANRIVSISWTLRDRSGAKVAGSTFPVELGRRANPTQPSEIVSSLYEFGGRIGVGAPVGSYTLRLEGLDRAGTVVNGTVEEVPFSLGATPVPVVTATPSVTPAREPCAPHSVPGRVEAEDYDAGGYRDTTPGNAGRAYRHDDVDIERGGGNFNVGWVKSSEWLEYTLVPGHTGIYRTSFRVASPWSGREIWVWIDGVRKATVSVPQTGGFGQWQVVSVPVAIPKGVHRLRLQFVGDAQNLDWIGFSR